jgi:hypothetical protein
MARATSDCNIRMSCKSRSWPSVCGLMSCAEMRTRSPERNIVPSTMPSTLFTGDFGQGTTGLLIVHRRGARNYPQSANPGKAGDQRLGQTVRKMLLFGVPGEIFHGQDGDGTDCSGIGLGHRVDRSNKAIPASGHGFDITWRFRRIAQRGGRSPPWGELSPSAAVGATSLRPRGGADRSRAIYQAPNGERVARFFGADSFTSYLQVIS